MSDPQGIVDPSGNASKNRAPQRRPGIPAAGPGLASRRILGMRVDATSYAECREAVLDWAGARSGGMVCVATTHMVMEAFDAPDFRRLVNAADRVTPDGVPLVWALRGLGVKHATRVYGPDLTPELCAGAEERGIPVGFYGGSAEVLERMREVLRGRFPRLQVPFAWAPPFRPLAEDEDERVTDAIRASGVGVLFVGLGCPKQERWMAAHRERLPCVLVGVGAAFDFLSGVKPQAPRWMMRAGLEWLFRLLCEPGRLWRRYLVGNTRFLFHFTGQLIAGGNPG